MAALWTEHTKMMKIGTLVEISMNTDLTNFGGSRTNSIAPPPVQKLNIELVIAPEPLIVEEWNLVHRLLSWCWSHSIAYIKTPYITVAAILKSTVFCLFATPPSKLIQFFPTLAQMIFDWAAQKWLNRFFLLILFKSYDVVNLTRSTQNWFRGCISTKLWSIETKLGTLHQHHGLRVHAKVGTAPPMGREISQIHFFAYNFLLVCQKIMFLGSMDSLGHAESEDVNFARIGWSTCPPFWNLSWIAISSEPFDISVQKSLGIMNTMSRRYPGSLKTAPPSVPEIN